MVIPPDTEMITREEGSTSFDPSLPPHIIPLPTLYSQFIDISPLPNHQHPSTNHNIILAEPGPFGLLGWRGSRSRVNEEEFEELTAFITRSGRVSKLVTYLHPEGKGKEKMTKEDIEIEV